MARWWTVRRSQPFFQTHAVMRWRQPIGTLHQRSRLLALALIFAWETRSLTSQTHTTANIRANSVSHANKQIRSGSGFRRILCRFTVILRQSSQTMRSGHQSTTTGTGPSSGTKMCTDGKTMAQAKLKTNRQQMHYCAITRSQSSTMYQASSPLTRGQTSKGQSASPGTTH